MCKVVYLLVFVAVVHCQNKDTLPCEIAKIFGSHGDCSNAATETTRVSPIVAPGIRRDLINTPCKLDDGNTGECVNHYQCNNGTVNTDGEAIINIRALDEGPCGSILLVCCSLGDKRLEPVTPKPAPRPVGCGWINPKGADMRTTGETGGETKFGEFPWMVAILDTEKNPSSGNSPRGLHQYIGGGSLIHPSAVMTAAHIVDTKRNLGIRAGEWDTQTTQELYPHQERNVASMFIHKDYIAGTLIYDVALLFLETPVVLASHIGVACLPPAQPRTPAGTRCIATGWGRHRFEKEDQYSVILKKIEVPVVSRPDCLWALRRTRLGGIFELHSSFMCAGGEKDKDTCKGDGGSPLSCPIEYEEGRYVVSGMVSWGIGCGEDGTPGVYVDVSKVRNWVDDKMAGKGYMLDTY